jgi:MoaA/NifB/PqqE/SkfB family radical SAM enzyme
MDQPIAVDTPGSPAFAEGPTQWKFSELIADTAVRERWEKVRRYFFLRESTYDMTNRCNIRCDGCYYYTGEKQFSVDNHEPSAWQALMRSEKERGITFAVLAGAEPSLVPELCRVCSAHIPLGAIATNGLRRLPSDIGYKIHISVWGSDATSRHVRNCPDMLARQMAVYQGDPRAVFVYTFTRHNIAEAEPVVRLLAEKDCRVTFNLFSAPVGYSGDLKHDRQSLIETRRAMTRLLKDYPDHLLYSHYNAAAHTGDRGLHGLFGCTYPRRNPDSPLGLGKSFRQYRSDLTWNRKAACCVPDTDCADCRHYAAGSAVVTARLFRHAVDPLRFNAWLDYVDTYLAVWVADYQKGANLGRTIVPPPGFESNSHFTE